MYNEVLSYSKTEIRMTNVSTSAKPVVGLFGTCGGSRWRDQFISVFEARGILYFNPMVPEGTWHPGLKDDENRHLCEDEIILFPVTSDTLGNGSLGEVGFSIASALRLNKNRFFVFLIDPVCINEQFTDAERKDNARARILIRSKLETMAAAVPGVYLVESLDQMLELTLSLYPIAAGIAELDRLYKKTA